MLHTNIKSKKAVSLPLETIVIAALVIVVLIVMIAIFTGKIGFYSKSLDYCPKENIVSSSSSCSEETSAAVPIKGSKEYCCVKLGDKS